MDDRYGFDSFFLWLVRLSDRLARILYRFDDEILDAVFVDGWGLLTTSIAELQRFFDDFFVDGAVDGVGALTRDAGGALSRVMRGQLQEYLLFAALAVSLFATFIMTR